MESSVPVAGIDVSKRFSDMCVLSPQNDVLLRQKIYHDITSMKLAEEKLHEIELKCGTRPVVVMESTSHYHLILFQFFTDAGFEVVVVNLIQSGALKNINVRKVKNDRVDAYRIAMLYRLKVLRPSQIPTSTLRGLRLLTRQRSELMGDVTRFKNRLTAYLDQIFPGYCEVFSDVGGVSSRAVLRRWPSPTRMCSCFHHTGYRLQFCRGHHSRDEGGGCLCYKNPVLAEYYEKKCAKEAKKVALVAVRCKLSNIICAVLRNRSPLSFTRRRNI